MYPDYFDDSFYPTTPTYCLTSCTPRSDDDYEETEPFAVNINNNLNRVLLLFSSFGLVFSITGLALFMV